MLGLAYEYADPPSAFTEYRSHRGSQLASAIADLPNELIEALRRATVSAQIDKVNALIDRVAERFPAAADQLQNMADHYEYEAILASLETGRRNE